MEPIYVLTGQTVDKHKTKFLRKGIIMSRLCLGTFFTAISLCIEEKSFTQGIDIAEIFVFIDTKYDPSPDLVSKFVRGIRNPSKSFVDTINGYDQDQYDSLCCCMDSIVNKLNTKSETILVKTITKIVKSNDTIPDDEIIDLVNGTMKKDLPGDYENISSFLTGVFLYTIKYTDNKDKNRFVKEIDKLYIAEFINPEKHNPIEGIITEPLTESEEIKVRQFFLFHEKEINLMPLCQIVYAYNPLHKYERTMFTEYNMFSQAMRKKVLELCDAANLIDLDILHWEEGLSAFCDDLSKYKLSSDRFIYLFSQYFPNSCRYASHSISGYDNNTFKRIYKPNNNLTFPRADLCSLNKYIDDYLWTNEKNIGTVPTKPMDYLWNNMDLGGCPEEELMYWLCQFIIDTCNNLSFRITGKPMYTNCYDDYAETIEDLFFCAVFALHKHFHFHNNEYMGMDVNA